MDVAEQAIAVYNCYACKICEKENIKFKTEVNCKKTSLVKPAHLNVPAKFTSPERITLTLQQKKLQCKQLEEQTSISNEKNVGH